MYGYIVSNAIIFNAYLIHHLVNIYIAYTSYFIILIYYITLEFFLTIH